MNGITTMHADCPACEAAVLSARTMACATGSVGATQVHDHRDPQTGQLVIDHQATWTRTPETTADLAAERAASMDAQLAAAALEAQDQMDRAIWSAGSDLNYAADLARRAGLDTVADALVVLAANVSDLMTPSTATATF